VEYGLTASYGSQTTLNTSLVTSHSAQLSGLTAETTYHYRVKSRDAAGNLSTSADGVFTTSAAPQGGYSYDNPLPLPPSNPTSTVNVSNVSQLISAINNLQSGQTISLAAGTYNLSGVTDALYIPEGINNWTIRGATGNRNDVVIRGAGMGGAVRFGFWIANSPYGTIADLTIDGVRDHGVIANGGADDLLIHNVRVVDSGDQFIKSTSDAGGNDRGIVEYSVFEYRTTDTNDYTNGVDVHSGDSWIVSYNLFRNILSPGGQITAGPAVMMWNGSTNSLVEGNTFINVARGVALGLEDKPGFNDHQGGIIRNNFFYRDPSLPQSVDVPIMVADSPNTKVYHNTLISRGSYANAIEYRFGSTTGVDIRNNLADAGIQSRSGATGTVNGNITNASLNWFVNPTAGDLHLLSTAPVINQASVLGDVPLDVDGGLRGANPDVGADEYAATLPGDVTPPVISSVAADNISGSGATVTWTTNEAADTQVEYGLTTSYGNQTTLDTSMVTSHSAQLSGLSAGTTYHYRIKSRDIAGNLSVSTNHTFTTSTAPDTIPPLISLIAGGSFTANGATVTWITNESADTQVEYGLTTSYGSQTTLNTSLVISHSAQLSGLTAGTTYHYRVKSRDAAGNLATSADFTLTTTTGSGLVSQFSFNEATGTTVVDQVGRTGAMSGPTWTSGQSGAGLNFDGSNDWVTVSDDVGLDLSGAMTLAAWVRPDSVTGWRTVLLKETGNGLAYGLYSSDDEGLPSVYINTGGTDIAATGPESLSAGTWSHLAATYDGSSLRLYVNGQLVATRNITGSIVTSNGPLRFGGNAIWGEHLDGSLDEVRIYNTVLTANEIAELSSSTNRPPIAQPDNALAPAASAIIINVLANDSDPDGHTLSIQSFTQPTHGTVSQVAGGLRYTPAGGYTGADSFNYTISDGRGGTATAAVSLTVQAPANQAPIAQADSAATPFATAVTVNVLANDSDPNGDPLSIQSFTQPAHGTVSQVAGGLRYTPAGGYTGADSFNYTISDGRGGTATAAVSLTVQAPANQAPIAQADSATTPFATAIIVNVLANDSDPNGDPLSIQSFSQPAHGTVSQVAGGLSYTPVVGYAGADSFNYTISDGRGGTATTAVSLTVQSPPNQAPLAQADSATTPTATAVTVNVLSNDSDPNGDTLSIQSFTQPAHGTVSQVAGGLRYTPFVGYAGADSFNYTISDGRGGTATAAVLLTVLVPDNRPPVAQADSAMTTAPSGVTVNVLANDSDPDGDLLSILSFTQPAHGTVSQVAGGLRYTPAAGHTGADGFNYTITDGRGDTATAAVSITVQTQPNQSPVAQADSATTPATTAVTVNVLANDSDPDSDTLSIQSFTQPAHGTVTQVAGGLRYTPFGGYVGADGFNYTITDGRGGTATTAVSLTVQAPANQSPIAQADSATTPAAIAITVNVLANDADPDGDTLTIQSFTQPAHGTVSQVAGGLRYISAGGYAGADSFNYSISDGRGGTATATVSLTVEAPFNRPPVAVNDSYSVNENESLNATAASGVLSNDGDPDGDGLIAQLVDGPDHGSLNLNSDGSFNYIPSANYVGADTFKYRAFDGAAASSDVTVSLTINAVSGLGTPGDDFRYLGVSNDGAMLQVFADDPSAPGATPIFDWPMNTNEPLVIDMLAGNDVVLIQLPSGQTGPIGGMQINFGTGTNHLQVASGRVRIDSVATGGVLSTTVASDAQLFTNRLNQNGLTVVGDGRVSLLPGSGLPSVITSLDLVAGATLDLNESALIVDYSAASPLATIRENIISGRGGSGLGNGSWTGTGITSSAVAARDAVAPETHSVGYADNAMLPLGPYVSFRGQLVDNTAILIAPTLTADANLDGLVNDEEVTVVGAFYRPGAPNPQWQWGDFDYNGSIDDDDITILGALYNPAPAPAPSPTFGSPTQWRLSTDWIDSVIPSDGRHKQEATLPQDYAGTRRPGALNAAAGSIRIAADDESVLDTLAHAIAAKMASQQANSAGQRLATAPRYPAVNDVWADGFWGFDP
jgi:hypothetical protein